MVIYQRTFNNSGIQWQLTDHETEDIAEMLHPYIVAWLGDDISLESFTFQINVEARGTDNQAELQSLKAAYAAAMRAIDDLTQYNQKDPETGSEVVNGTTI